MRAELLNAYDGANKALDQMLRAYDQQQPGDPKKGTDLIVDVVRSEGGATGKKLPFRLPIGKDSVETIREKCYRLLAACDEWESLSNSTAFDS